MIKVRDITIAESIFLGTKEIKVIDGKLYVGNDEFLLANTSELISGVPLTINQAGTISPLLFTDTVTLHVNADTGNDELTSGAEALPYATLDKALEDSQLYGFYPSITIVVHGSATMSDSHSIVQSKDITIRGASGTSPSIDVGMMDDGSSCALSIRKGSSVYVENIEITQQSALTISSSIFTGEISYLSLVGLTFTTGTHSTLVESFGNISIKIHVSTIDNLVGSIVNNMGSTMVFMSIDAPSTISSLLSNKIAANVIVDTSGNTLNLFLAKAS